MDIIRELLKNLSGNIDVFADLADKLDKQGLFKEANKIDAFIEKYCDDLHKPQKLLAKLLRRKVEAAEYQGKKVKLNDPVRNPSGSKKKFHVFVKDKNGKIKKVQFGDPNMEIKRDDPKRRKSFRARHKCDTEKDRTSPRYWSCYNWRKNEKVND